MFANMMVMTWYVLRNSNLSLLMSPRSSATNCARVYNLSIGDYTRKLQTQYRLLNTEMTMDHVWDAFFLHGLILDANRSNDRLTLPNNEVEHQDRYSAALQVRNLKYQGPMRDGWNHCCDTCSRTVARAEGNGKLFRLDQAIYSSYTSSSGSCCGDRWDNYRPSLLCHPRLQGATPESAPSILPSAPRLGAQMCGGGLYRQCKGRVQSMWLTDLLSRGSKVSRH
jgi:hypothetical protein